LVCKKIIKTRLLFCLTDGHKVQFLLMAERLTEEIRSIVESYGDDPIMERFETCIKEGCGLTRDENPQIHFCVYFAAYDSDIKEVFVGHHKKSGLWIFNGGHIDEGEVPLEALSREMNEEWGLEIGLDEIGESKLLTVTEINNPTKQTCTRHYDIWYFVPVDKDMFKPDEKLLDKEFHSTTWLDVRGAREVITDPNTLIAIERFEEIFK